MILSNSRTLVEDLAFAKQKGYTEEFYYKENKIIGRNNKKSYVKEDCKLMEYCVHESMSDPSDQSILFLIRCTDGTKGCLSSAYGTYADDALIQFCLNLEKEQ